jgi:hypothetical protein
MKAIHGRLWFRKLLVECWIGLFKFMVQREYVRISYSLRCMRNLELYGLPMGLMKSIYCIPHTANADYRQLGRYEVRKAEEARKNNEAMKEKQANLLKSKGFKAHL